MIFQGRSLDVLQLWGQFVDFPPNIGHPLPTFLPKVKCPNPDHRTEKQHFQINSRQPTVHCFARCGIQGSYEHAIAIIHGWYKDDGEPDEKKARKFMLGATRVALGDELEKHVGTAGLRKTFDGDSKLATDQKLLDSGELTFLPKQARAYLERRGVDDASRGMWQIGWDEDAERLTVPAYDVRGTFRFLIRCRIDGGKAGKYLYTDGGVKTAVLFGACFADPAQLKSLGLVLCEGPLDAIRLHQLGISTGVAILGTGLSTAQVRLIDKLKPRRVYCLFDKDASGIANIERAGEMIHKVPLMVCRYPAGKSDPAELTRKETERSLERAIPLATFYRLTRNGQPKSKGVHVGKKR